MEGEIKMPRQGYGRKDGTQIGFKQGGRGRNRTTNCRHPEIKKMRKFKFLDPEQIMVAVVILIMLAVAIFIISAITTSQTSAGIGTAFDGRFTVTDSSVAQDCDTGKDGLTGITVTQQLSDGSWVAVSSAFWAYDGTTVTVQPGGMY